MKHKACSTGYTKMLLLQEKEVRSEWAVHKYNQYFIPHKKKGHCRFAVLQCPKSSIYHRYILSGYHSGFISTDAIVIFLYTLFDFIIYPFYFVRMECNYSILKALKTEYRMTFPYSYIPTQFLLLQGIRFREIPIN